MASGDFQLNAPPSESPTYGENTVAADAERKAEPVAEAAARTSFVLPQPGGPYSKQPLMQRRVTRSRLYT